MTASVSHLREIGLFHQGSPQEFYHHLNYYMNVTHIETLHTIRTLLLLLYNITNKNLWRTLSTILYCHVQIILLDPLPETAQWNKYIVTCTDYFSKWPKATPLPDKTATAHRSCRLLVLRILQAWLARNNHF